ncbi:cupin domain-containing protein [Gramella sp. KN1008]|uniref:cupin domain-containing protein n=1 Tax=Gramella sp. KN1008 TaxID=2529298 RepID=UPI0013F156BD|nr:cupin domain-containing protein [Gramella sp. KN1008]
MNKICTFPMVLLSLFLIGGNQSVAQVGEMKFPEGSVQHVVLAEDIQWKPCPPNLPGGCEIVVLEGDPKSPDLFTIRFKVKEGFKMPSHTHPRDERVTVISGKVSVAFGREATHEEARQFGPGDYYVNSRDAVHTVWADSDCILQITGIGPWQAKFIEE